MRMFHCNGIRICLVLLYIGHGCIAYINYAFGCVQSIFTVCNQSFSLSQCAINLLACVLITVCLLSVNRITVLRLPYSPAIQGLYTLWNFL